MLSWICAASSRVGVSINALTLFDATLLPLLVERRCNSGKVNPAVLPVPVCAAAIISRPERTAGIACA